MSRFLRENGLSLVLAVLFLGSLGGQFFAGLGENNDELTRHHRPPMSAREYLVSSHFAEATLENWESEFLQMSMFVLLTAFLYQKGSSESKRIGVTESVDVDPREVTLRADAPWPARRGGVALRLYEHSLGLTFTALFLLTLILHAVAGAKEFSEDAIAHGGEAVTAAAYLVEPRFWFESFQNWQSEFLSLWMMVVLTIFLRQRWSPESKPVHAPHRDTGRD
jgi:hypothetical protein